MSWTPAIVRNLAPQRRRRMQKGQFRHDENNRFDQQAAHATHESTSFTESRESKKRTARFC
jgi:hypothetical protein